MLMTSATFPARDTLREGWGDVIPASDFPQNDWSQSTFGLWMPNTSIDDRADGKCRPLYEIESDLAYQRAVVRRLGAATPIREAIFEQLCRHIFGAGVTYTVGAKEGKQADDVLIAQIQSIVDEFIEVNDLTNRVDIELHNRSREDGEAFAWLKWHDGVSLVDIPEPDQITEPTGGQSLYDYVAQTTGIDCDAFVPSWSFGVLTRRDACHRPLAYFVTQDDAARDYDVVSASDMVHIKRNVPIKAKRGVSDILMSMAVDMRAESKNATNVITGSALQAAIAWIEEQAPGTTQAQAQATGPNDLTRRQPTGVGTGGGTRDVKQSKYGPGSIVRPSPGRTYKPGPMGAERNGNFELAAQYVLRRCGIRWSMPEYMITGDASNGNYSSLLVAESPFVKARESDQQFYGSALRELCWKAVGQAWRNGRLDTLGMSIGELKRVIDITPAFPEVATRDKKALAERLEIEKRNGWVSDDTAMSELGRDPNTERAAGARSQSPVPSFQPPLAESHQAQRILSRVWEGYP